MLRIRRISDLLSVEDVATLARAQEILRRELAAEDREAVEKLPDMLRDPVKYEFKTVLLVADDLGNRIKGLALASYTTSPPFVFLDLLYSPESHTGRGVEEALYQRLKEHVTELDPIGVFAEAAPDDPKLCRHRADLQRNVERLMFLEGLGLRPITGTRYEKATASLAVGPRYLLFDALSDDAELAAEDAREVIRVLLAAQHADEIPAEEAALVVESVTDDPVKVRGTKYTRRTVPEVYRRSVPDDDKILLVSNERHGVHDVKRRGNVQVPARLLSVLREAAHTDLFRRQHPDSFPDAAIEAVHGDYFAYLREACETVGPDRVVYPSVFPRRHYDRLPADLVQRLGYHCVDLFTPLNANAFLAAREAVDCALTVAEKVRRGERRLAYALVRPPGHHAERSCFGGYCYLNSSSIAADRLSGSGKVAMLDLDYHHGNGHQDIFYRRGDVLTVSIHRDPLHDYPFYAGFADEEGEAEGEGMNRNFPLGRDVDGEAYREVLDRAIGVIDNFGPDWLVVPLGLDTARLDPLGTWSLTAEDQLENGRRLGALGLPTVVVQEGGYDTRNLGKNACHFFAGLWEGAHGHG
ncbi:MAG: histone deacetylase family protein [Acidobacteriota bacterium]